jgi:hypothetical protein
LPKACNDEWDLMSVLSSGSSGPTPPGGHFTTNIFFLQNSLPMAMDARGPAIDVSDFGGGRCRTYLQHPQGAHHRCFQLQWWPLPDLPVAPPKGPPSTPPTPVVAAAKPAGSTPRGPAIDVSNSGGGRCQTCRQHPQGARHRRLQLRWWPLPDLPTAPPRGPAIDVSLNFSGNTYQGAIAVNNTAMKKNWVLAVLRTRES